MHALTKLRLTFPPERIVRRGVGTRANSKGKFHQKDSSGTGQHCEAASSRRASPEARCLPLSESQGKLGSYVIPKYALCNGSKDES